MDPQTIFENIHNDNFTFPKENSFFFYDLPTTIHFPPSLFVFHPINTIYIFFRELVLVETKTDPISILKKGKNKITKRVRICEDLPVITNNKTKKNRMGKWLSGSRRQTVNLLTFVIAGSNPAFPIFFYYG